MVEARNMRGEIAHYEFTPEATAALEAVSAASSLAFMGKESLRVPSGKIPECLARQVAELLHYVSKHGYAVISGIPHGDTSFGFGSICMSLARAIGDLAVQNAAGDVLVEVLNRDKGRIEDGARYHQTRQGGQMHTDSVNHPDAITHLLLGCSTPALVGGETILALAREVAAELNRFPEVQAILRGTFWFEGRGMGGDVGFFRIPILSGYGGGARFRYLRSYIEAAHRAKCEKLDRQSIDAFDLLDALLESSALQRRVTMQKGDILLAEDTRVFHGRTSFYDSADHAAGHRRMFRVWIRRLDAIELGNPATTRSRMDKETAPDGENHEL
jgi:Taurine catabolism dioxygenase TauD, TfdA family